VTCIDWQQLPLDAEARAGSKPCAKKFFRDAVQDSLRPR
jgi:hypothetical protein